MVASIIRPNRRDHHEKDVAHRRSGTWKLDYDYYKSDGSASRLLLNDGQKNHEVIVTAIPGNEKTLAFKLVRKLAGKPFVSYTYNLTSSTKSEEAQP